MTKREPIAEARDQAKPIQERQGKTNLKTHLIVKEVPLPAIAHGAEILLALNRHRFLTNTQISNLHFVDTMNSHGNIFTAAGAKDAADLSVKRLWESKLIERMMVFQTSRTRDKKTGKPSGKIVRAPVNLLSKEGAEVVETLLEEESDLVNEIRWSRRLKRMTDKSIDHHLEVNDALIALIRGTVETGSAKLLCLYDDDLLAKKTRFKGFIPDGFCLVQVITGSGNDESARIFPIFIEVDRGNQTIKSSGRTRRDWYSKIVRYGEYFAIDYHLDPFYQTLGFSPEEVNWFECPRVLTITTTPERVEKMIEVTLQAQGRNTYWYASREAVYSSWNNIMRDCWRLPTVPTPHLKRLDAHLFELPQIGPDYPPLEG